MRNQKNRSLLIANEDFEGKRDAKTTLLDDLVVRVGSDKHITLTQLILHLV